MARRTSVLTPADIRGKEERALHEAHPVTRRGLGKAGPRPHGKTLARRKPAQVRPDRQKRAEAKGGATEGQFAPVPFRHEHVSGRSPHASQKATPRKTPSRRKDEVLATGGKMPSPEEIADGVDAFRRKQRLRGASRRSPRNITPRNAASRGR